MSTDSYKIPVVNRDDEVIAHVTRSSLKDEQIYRTTTLWMTNSKGKVLIAQRHQSKSHSPGKRGPAVAGTVEEGETYVSNILKEAEEELGLTDIEPVTGPKREPLPHLVHKHFTQFYTLTLDIRPDEFVLAENEVAAVQWVSPKELRERVTTKPEEFVPGMQEVVDAFTP